MRFLLLFFCILSIPLSAQVYTLPIDGFSQLRQNRAEIGVQQSLHFGAKPILRSDADLSEVPGFAEDTVPYYYKLTEKIFSEHLIELDKPDFKIYADFLFDFAVGRETVDQISGTGEETSLFQNTRGFAIQGQIGKRVFFYTDFRENQGRYPSYLTRFIDSTEVFPGSGRVKPFGVGGFDYSMASGVLGIEAADWLNFSLGHSKQIIGHGYRSLLLSDNSHNYPFVAYEVDFLGEKIQYRYTLALLQSLDRLPQGETPEAIFKRKESTWHYLSFKPLPNLELGFFEEILWQVFDDSLGSKPFNYRALLPIPFLNSAILGLEDEENNARVGISAAWYPIPKMRLYGQLLSNSSGFRIDGYQIGGLWSGIFDRVDFQLELNQSNPNATVQPAELQSAYHFNQPLGHVLGRDFEELVGVITYYHRRIYARITTAYYNLGDEASNLWSLRNTEVSNSDFRLGYIFNPSCNFQIYTGYTYRSEEVEKEKLSNGFWYLGIKTSMSNIYSDF
ncbi:MAG: hypothetical protein MK086_09665 [Flavobacteriales bacterium]|nr:hypothetical protein [Flavobacteriales bacterium]